MLNWEAAEKRQTFILFFGVCENDDQATIHESSRNLTKSHELI